MPKFIQLWGNLDWEFSVFANWQILDVYLMIFKTIES